MKLILVRYEKSRISMIASKNRKSCGGPTGNHRRARSLGPTPFRIVIQKLAGMHFVPGRHFLSGRHSVMHSLLGIHSLSGMHFWIQKHESADFCTTTNDFKTRWARSPSARDQICTSSQFICSSLQKSTNSQSNKEVYYKINLKKIYLSMISFSQLNLYSIM